MTLTPLSKQRLSMGVQFLAIDFVSGGIILLLLTIEENSLSMGGVMATRIGTLVFSTLTLVVVIRASPPLIERLLGSAFSYFVFSVITGSVFLFLYLTSSSGQI